MGVGNGSTPWLEVGDGTLDKGEHPGCRPEADGSSVASSRALSDWTLLFAFTAVMIIPFVLVAWLMS
ncbi:MAG: hypothetical protein ACK4UW_10040 [Rhizobium rhizophilum]|uniref:hypothetical protein n=1 Tax=Rhizobium rhizophilum TaxID=1850373 RepID=UPI001D3CB504|nr:hypothetical protein [Rhizobium sp.]